MNAMDPKANEWLPSEDPHQDSVEQKHQPAPRPAEWRSSKTPKSSRPAPPEGPDLERLTAQLSEAEKRIKLAEQRTREAESVLRKLTTG